MLMDTVHYSVLQREVMDYLAPSDGTGLFIDSTLGEGGHTDLLLENYPDLQAVGLDADSHILEIARKRLEPFFEEITDPFCPCLFHFPTQPHYIIALLL